MPLCLGTSGSVRARRIPHSARWAAEVHTFWPVTTHSSPSRTARVRDRRRGRSRPPARRTAGTTPRRPGASAARKRRFCSSVPWAQERRADHADGDGEHAVRHAAPRLLLVKMAPSIGRPPRPPNSVGPGDAGPARRRPARPATRGSASRSRPRCSRWTTCRPRSRRGAPSGWRWPRARRGPRRGTPPPRGCRRSPPPLRLEHVLVRGQSVRVSSSSASTAGVGRLAPLPQRGEEALDALDHPRRAQRREDLEGVLGALHLGVEHRARFDTSRSRSTNSRASSTGASVSRSPWITKNGGTPVVHVVPAARPPRSARAPRPRTPSSPSARGTGGRSPGRAEGAVPVVKS